MRGIRWTRLLAAATVALVATLASGCVLINGLTVGQLETIGDVQLKVGVCASGTVAGACGGNGNSGIPAFPGPGQVLLAVQAPVTVALPTALTSAGPEALAFSESPSYAAELQRLNPAPAGTRWVGYVSAVIIYSDTGGPQSITVPVAHKLIPGADGSPFRGSVGPLTVVGGRVVTDTLPGTRPVSCGSDPRALVVESPGPGPAPPTSICSDISLAPIAGALPTRDLGVLAAGASASGAPGTLVSLPFTLRYAGPANPAANFSLRATTGLAGAFLATAPDSLVPAADSDTRAVVAIGIPAGARAGTYDVTLSARLANGQTRTGVGKLRVLAAGAAGVGTTGRPGASGASGASSGRSRLRLTTILPKGLSAALARTQGIAVLIGATKAGPARVQLFQGPAKKPKATKRVRLRVPGPARVLLKSAALVKGPYRVVIRSDGRTFRKRAQLTK